MKVTSKLAIIAAAALFGALFFGALSATGFLQWRHAVLLSLPAWWYALGGAISGTVIALRVALEYNWNKFLTLGFTVLSAVAVGSLIWGMKASGLILCLAQLSPTAAAIFGAIMAGIVSSIAILSHEHKDI
jgi:hypothetical protein